MTVRAELVAELLIGNKGIVRYKGNGTIWADIDKLIFGHLETNTTHGHSIWTGAILERNIDPCPLKMAVEDKLLRINCHERPAMTE